MTGLSAAANAYVRLSGSNVEIWQNTSLPVSGNPTQLVSLAQMALLPGLSIVGSARDDALILDFSAGDPLPSGGASFDGGAGVNRIQFIGTSDDDTLTASSTGLNFASASFSTVSIRASNRM